MTSTRKQKKHPEAVDRTTEDRREDTGSRTEPNGHEHGLRMHTLHANVPIPYLTPGDVMADAKAAGAATAKLAAKPASMPGMPPPRQLAFYGGLGALVVAGLVDFPVAVAIGAATIIARGRGERERSREEGERSQEERSQEEPSREERSREQRPAAAQTAKAGRTQVT